MPLLASVHRRPSRPPGRHRARFHIEDGPPFAPPEDETLTDEDEGADTVEDEPQLDEDDDVDGLPDDPALSAHFAAVFADED